MGGGGIFEEMLGKGLGGGGFGGGPFGGGPGAFGSGTTASKHVKRELPCTLEELYHGVTKKLKITRQSTTLQRSPEKILELEVRPGWKAGTKVTFDGEGDEISQGQAQDLVFFIQEKKHSRFIREGSNLIFHSKIPLVD